jgi:hypothetical protein
VSSYNKAKGSKFETDVMKYLRKLGHFAVKSLLQKMARKMARISIK